MKLEEIEKMCDEASDGPWKLDELSRKQYMEYGDDTLRIGLDGPDMYYNHVAIPDAQFIAMARTELPKLLAVAEAAKRFYSRPECVGYGFSDKEREIIEALEALEKE